MVVIVLCLFFVVPQIGLFSEIVIFSGHTHLLLLRISTDPPESLLLAYTNYGCREDSDHNLDF